MGVAYELHDTLGRRIEPGDIGAYVGAGSGALYVTRVLLLEVTGPEKGLFVDVFLKDGRVQTHPHKHKFSGVRIIRLDERVDISQQCVLCSEYGHASPPCA